ncbi:CBS domain-containing protein [Henriciella aquimarina]|uniref:CBS domain-containing protein n=1 Tax=Henriciella aquimarina TaxID=545261 RepID=UPI000A069C68|nr:CBS domain-containing protein [Henriciella aquimarina]
MQIRDIMHRDCSFIGSDESLQLAATKMEREGIGALPVADNDKLVGMITDRDIVTRAVATNRDVRHTKVRELMSDRVLYCYDDEDIEKVAENMAEQEVRRLPVMNRAKELQGMVSLGDIAAKASGNAAGESLKRIAEAA